MLTCEGGSCLGRGLRFSGHQSCWICPISRPELPSFPPSSSLHSVHPLSWSTWGSALPHPVLLPSPALVSKSFAIHQHAEGHSICPPEAQQHTSLATTLWWLQSSCHQLVPTALSSKCSLIGLQNLILNLWLCNLPITLELTKNWNSLGGKRNRNGKESPTSITMELSMQIACSRDKNKWKLSSGN